MKRSLEYLEQEELDIKIAMIHFPPTNKFFPENKHVVKKQETSEITYEEQYDERFFGLFKEHGVKIVVFGHVHNIEIPTKKTIEGIKLYCVSTDLINHDPRLILE